MLTKIKEYFIQMGFVILLLFVLYRLYRIPFYLVFPIILFCTYIIVVHYMFVNYLRLCEKQQIYYYGLFLLFILLFIVAKLLFPLYDGFSCFFLLNLFLLFLFTFWYCLSAKKNNYSFVLFKYPHFLVFLNSMFLLLNQSCVVLYVLLIVVGVTLAWVNVLVLILDSLILFIMVAFFSFCGRLWIVDYFKNNFNQVDKFILYSDFRVYLYPSMFLVTCFSPIMSKNIWKYYYKDFDCGVLLDGDYNRFYVSSMPQKKYHLIKINSKKFCHLSKKEIAMFNEILKNNERAGITTIIYDANKKIIYDNLYVKDLSLHYLYYKNNGVNTDFSFIIDDIKYHVDENYLEIKKQLKEIVLLVDQSNKKDCVYFLSNLLYIYQDRLNLFYNMIKICEFTFFYRCMQSIDSYSSIVDLEKPSLGDYLNYIQDSIVYDNPLLIESAQFLDRVSVRNGKSTIKGKSITYMELCQVICRVRNRFIGHGSMVYAISEDFVFHILVVGKVLLQRYYETFLPLKSLTIPLKKGNPPIMKKYKKQIFYYNVTLDKDYYRYLNYESGKLITYYLPNDTVIPAICLQSDYELDKDNVYE